MDLKRVLAFFLAALFLILSVPGLADEEELHLNDAIYGNTADVPGDTEDEPVVVEKGKVLRLDDGSVILTITAVGDITIGRNVQYSGKSIFTRELEKQGNDPNFIFRNIHTVFEGDTLTIANFEGVLADEYQVPTKKRNNEFLFLAPTDYASILPGNSVEMVTIENNHTGDFGDAGLESTRRALTDAGVFWADKENVCIYEVEGFRIALLAYQTLNQPYTSKELEGIVDGKIKALKQDNDLVFVYFHWGNELDYSPKENQISLGRAAIDSGADLVLGSHSHRINPIECYQGKYIVYSLANCSFAGNNKPSDMFTFVFQTRFRYKNGTLISNIFRIIPCRISSRKDYNDFAITPLTEQTNIDTVINTMLSSGRKLTYAVTNYPLEWE